MNFVQPTTVFNHISTVSSLGHSPIDASQTGIHSFISCFIHSSSDYSLKDSYISYDHNCNFFNCFTSFYKIKPINANLPNGFSILVHHASNVHFSPYLFRSPIFIFLRFQSRSKICNSLSSFVQFSTKSSVIQDL